MSRFAQYFIRYNMELAPYEWEERQKHLAALFETDESIEFSIQEETQRKVFNHRVYHLQNNPSIVVMQFANAIDIPIEKNYRPEVARDEPSCFVIIDNRENVRSVAIQKRKKAFGNPGQVADILTHNLTVELYNKYCYSLKILPEFYPEDLFRAWEKLQRHANEMRFGTPNCDQQEMLKRVEMLKEKGIDYYDDSMMSSLAQIAVEARKAKYDYLYTVKPQDKKVALYVDKTSTFMKNLLTMSRALDMPVEIVTSDSGTFRCFIDDDEDNTDKIVCREFDAKKLELLFERKDKNGEPLEPARINEIEGEIVDMMNTMKHLSEDIEQGVA